MSRLKRLWQHYAQDETSAGIELEQILDQQEIEKLDLFDAIQLKAVLGVCKGSKTVSDAGRKLYAASRIRG